MPYDVAIIIVSDRSAAGQRQDGCLPVFQDTFDGTDFRITADAIVPDDPALIRQELEKMLATGADLILTSGGTGCAPRDHTPEATAPLLEKPTPGIDEAIRSYSYQKSHHAMFSRAVSGIVGSSLIINLPGSPRAVREILEFLLPVIAHPLKLISGEVTDCAKEKPPHD